MAPVELIETTVELDSLTVEQPQNFVIAPEAVSDRCLSPAASDNPSQVSITGRGGVPTDPSAPLPPASLENRLDKFSPSAQNPSGNPNLTASQKQKHRPIAPKAIARQISVIRDCLQQQIEPVDYSAQFSLSPV